MHHYEKLDTLCFMPARRPDVYKCRPGQILSLHAHAQGYISTAPSGLPIVFALIAILLWVMIDNREKYLPMIRE